MGECPRDVILRSLRIQTDTTHIQLFLVCSMRRWSDTDDDRRRFNVSYITWRNFFDVIMEPDQHGDIMDIVANADCVIGGVDTTTSYM